MRYPRVLVVAGIVATGCLSLSGCNDEEDPGSIFLDTVGPTILNRRELPLFVFGTGGTVTSPGVDCGPVDPTKPPVQDPWVACATAFPSDLLDPQHGAGIPLHVVLDESSGAKLLHWRFAAFSTWQGGLGGCGATGSRVDDGLYDDIGASPPHNPCLLRASNNVINVAAVFSSRPVPDFSARVGNAPLRFLDTLASPVTAHFNACRSWDPDRETLRYDIDFEGDGVIDSSGTTGADCRWDHTYELKPGTSRTFAPRVCVVDLQRYRVPSNVPIQEGEPIREPLCKEYELTVRGPVPPGTPTTPGAPPTQPPVISGLTAFPPSVFNGGDPFDIEFALDDPDGDRIDWSLSGNGIGGSTCAPTSGSVIGSGNVIVSCTSGGVEVITYTVDAVDENGAAATPMSVDVDVF